MRRGWSLMPERFRRECVADFDLSQDAARRTA